MSKSSLEAVLALAREIEHRNARRPLAGNSNRRLWNLIGLEQPKSFGDYPYRPRDERPPIVVTKKAVSLGLYEYLIALARSPKVHHLLPPTLRNRITVDDEALLDHLGEQLATVLDVFLLLQADEEVADDRPQL